MKNRGWYAAEKNKIAAGMGYANFLEAYKDLYHNGKRTSEIGQMFGETRGAVLYRLHQIGAIIKPRGGNNHDPQKFLSRMQCPTPNCTEWIPETKTGGKKTRLVCTAPGMWLCSKCGKEYAINDK